MKTWKQGKLINFLFLASFLMLIFSIFLYYQQINRSLNTGSWVMHAHGVITKADQFNFRLTDLESRVSIYLLSKQKEMIANIEDKQNVVNKNLNELAFLTRDDFLQQSRISLLKPLINEKFNIMNQILKASDMDIHKALQIAGGERRIYLKNKIATLINEIKNDELKLLEARNADYQKELYISEEERIFILLLASILFCSCFVLLNHYLSARNQADIKRYQAENLIMFIICDALKKSDERYLLATEASNVGLFDWETGTDNVYYSPSFKKMLGYAENEFPDSVDSFEKHIHPADHDRVWKLVNLHLDTHVPYKTEYRLRTKFGDYKWFEASGQAQWDGAGKPIRMLGSVIDINDRKMVEASLAVQHEIISLLASENDPGSLLEKIISAISTILPSDVAGLWMSASPDSSLKCMDFWKKSKEENSEFEKITRKLRIPQGADLPGLAFKTKNPLFIQDIAKDNVFLRTSEAKQYGLCSAYFIPLMGQERVFGVLEIFTKKQMKENESILNMLFYIGCLMGEYLERYQANKKLHESEAYKTAILDSASESIITIDDNGLILSCNPQTIKIFCYQNEDMLMVGRNIDTLLPNFTRKFYDFMDQKFYEFSAKYENGVYFPAEIAISRMDISNRISYVLIIRDISERKKIEKMKNDFISLVSHELRTPLTSIQGSIDLILDETVGVVNEEARELLNITRQNGERLVRLINDILDIDKIEAGEMHYKFQISSINSLVAKAIRFNQPYAEKNDCFIRFVTSLADTYVNVDQDRIIQVLTNLISNAVKFTPRGGSIDVSLFKMESKVRVIVTDRGPGISEEFQSQVFTRFAQEDSSITRKMGGTGLGLSISKAIIEDMQGEIDFTTGADGSSFYFDLPIVTSPAEIV